MPAAKRGLAVLLAAAALPGCGGSDDAPDARTTTQPAPTVGGDQRGVLDTIDALQTASRSGDGRRICSRLFTPQLVRSIEKSSARSCPAEVRARLFRRDESLAVQRGIDVRGSTATAVIRDSGGGVSTLHMLKRAGRWRIDRVMPRGAS